MGAEFRFFGLPSSSALATEDLRAKFRRRHLRSLSVGSAGEKKRFQKDVGNFFFVFVLLVLTPPAVLLSLDLLILPNGRGRGRGNLAIGKWGVCSKCLRSFSPRLFIFCSAGRVKKQERLSGILISCRLTQSIGCIK